MIEQLLHAELSSRLDQPGAGVVPESVWSAALAVLNEDGMTPDEEQSLEAQAAENALDPVARLLGMRIERALRVGLDAAGVGETVVLPEVLVMRAPEGVSRDDEGRILSAALARLRAGLSANMKGSGDRLVVVAARQLYDKLKQVMPVGRVGGKPLIEYCDDGPREGGTTAPIEIVAGEVTLAPLEDRATVHLRATFGDSLAGDSMQAAWMAASDASLEVEELAAEDAPEVEPGAAPMPVPARDPSDPDAMIGSLFHRKYRIVRRIGKGGFGSVYEAADERGAGNRVAIKVLSGKAAESAAQQQSFKDEARRVTRLSHPNIVDWKVFDQTDDGVPYFVMELVEGEEFETTLRRERKLAPDRAARLLLQVLDALRAAHHLSKTESILHLDLKPANLFCIPARRGRPEQLKVIDFGIGQYIGDGEVRDDTVVPAEGIVEGDLSGPGTLTFSRPPSTRADSSGITRSKGCTPEYASPEQCAHVMYMQDIVALDGRSDLYSLGVIAFEMLTGQLPFKSRTRLDVMRMHREDPAPKVGSMGTKVPRKLAKFVDRCLQKDPAARWRSTQEAYQYLHEFVYPPVWKAVVKVTVPIVLVGTALGSWAWATREIAVPTVGVFSAQGDNLEHQALFLGPGRTRAEVELQAADGVLPDSTTQDWTVRRASDGAPADGWQAEWTSPGVVAIAATDTPEGRIEEQVELVLGDDELRSRPIRLGWIGAGSWLVDSVEIGGRALDDLATLEIDPKGIELDLWVRGEARDDLTVVAVSVDDGAVLSLRRGSESGERSRYGLQLKNAGMTDGPHELHVSLIDAAGTEWSRDVQIDIASGEPEVLALALVDRSGDRTNAGDWPPANKIRDAYTLTPRTEPGLHLELARAADVSWQVFVDGTDEPLLRGHVQGRRVVNADLAGLSQLRGGDPFRGRIELVIDEDAYVLHAPGSGRGDREVDLYFNFENTLPSFAASWGSHGLARELAPALDGTPVPVFVNVADAQLTITRNQPVPMQVELAWWPTDRPQDVQSVESEELRNPQVQQASLPIALAADGEWTVRLRAFRFDVASQTVGERADVEVLHALVLDRSAPVANLVGLEDGEVLRGTGLTGRELFVHFDASTGEPREAAVDLSWGVTRLGSEDGAFIEGHLDAQIPTGDATGAGLDSFWQGAGTLADGSYRLELSGQDRAGNTVPASGVGFEVSMHGPAVALEKPSGVGKWRRDGATGKWSIHARVSDPNGVNVVTCELVSGDTVLPIALVAEEGSSAEDRSLVASIVLPYTLSEASVQLVFHATDVYDTPSTWSSANLELPLIARPSPERIAVAFGEHDIESMRLVRGNADFRYLFGGRGDEVENPDFARAGLPAFNNSPRRSRSRSWQVPIAAGTIEDYYLDEREVSVGQFMDFLRDENGYADERNWLDAARPAADRRSQLLSRLAQADSDLPVAGINWSEACAYANWVGKRLPSWVEWEFAVRGGAEYRPCATGGTQVAEAGAPRELARASQLQARGLGPWTPDRRFADLCGNVAEWTSTGIGDGDGDGESARYPHQWALAEPSRLQASVLDAAEYWVVGGHYDLQRNDFSVADQRPAAFDHATIGFRCAIALTAVQDRLGNQDPDGPNFEEQR